MSRIVGWALIGRLLRLGAVGCFLAAFGLPSTIPAIITVAVVYGSGSMLPIPGAGLAASVGALLVALPGATGQTVDAGAVTALIVAQPLLLTTVGVTTSVILLATLLGVRTPMALIRSGRSLAAQPSGAQSR